MSASDTTRVLFVCLGNICRSPLAEGVFRELVRDASLEDRYEVDSAGTGAWHVGEPADPRSRAVARKHGIVLDGRARQVSDEDFRTFHVIIAMDRENQENLERIRNGGRARLHLLREFDPDAGDDAEVPDPYYGGPGGFDQVFHMVHRSCLELLDALEAERK
ncbi:MAG: low molecular weight phosphotyrosine protein phosphatase [Gemmatimonadales bacterium]|nr:MAG: low molecular weight phosphotyrosine protein phosphatase [Gemmatimonadales bacterium]